MARIYAVKTSDKERMMMLCDPAWPAESDETGAGGIAGSPAQSTPPARPGEEESGGTGELDLSQANIARTSIPVKIALMTLLETYRLAFPANPKMVPACNRAKMQLPLANSSCTPHAAKQRRYSPEETAMIQSEITKI